MLKYLSLSLISLLVISGVGQSQTMSCQPVSAKTAKLRTRVVAYAASPDYSKFRSNFGVTGIDTSQVTVVSSDSVCDAVTRAINGVSETQRSTSFIVVQFGSFYAATVPEGDDLVGVYILDQHPTVLTVFVGT